MRSPGSQYVPQLGGRLDEIQGLRALTIILIVIYHAGVPLHGGFVAIDVFFVISGYVITRMLLREVNKNGRINFANFYKRRVRRLLPMAALAVTVTVALSFVLQSPVGAQPSTALSAFGASSWTANAILLVLTRGYFALNLHTVPLLHTWSLAVEEQFYVVFPAVIGLGVYLGRRRNSKLGRSGISYRYIIGFVAIALVISYLIALWLTFGAKELIVPRGIAYFSPMSRAWEFAAGSLLCFVPHGKSIPKKWATPIASAGMIILIGACLVVHESDPFPGFIVLAPVIASVLMIATIGHTTWVSKFLSLGPMQRMGDWSYSWYLWHWPFIVYVQVYWPANTVLMLIAGFAGLPLGALTYRLVEQPFRQRTGKGRFPTLRLVAACIAVPVALSAVLLVGAKSYWGNDKMRDFAAQVTPQPEGNDVCLGSDRVTERDMSQCVFGADRPGAPIILVGDSNAAQYTNGFMKVAEELDRPLTVAAVKGCSLIDADGHLAGTDMSDCYPAYLDTMTWLAKQKPSLVVIASGNGWVDEPGVSVTDPESDTKYTDRKGKGVAWRDGLERTFAQLRDDGHTLLQINAVPHFYTALDRYWGPETCDFVQTMKDPANCGDSLTRQQALAKRHYGYQAEHDAAIAADVPEIDVRDEICKTVCATNDGDRWIYRDGGHLSVGEAVRLAPLFKREVEAASR